MPATIDTRELYRLPWNLADNGISWLEPTAQCNLVCDGCYRRNRVEHKSWEQTLHELDLFDALDLVERGGCTIGEVIVVGVQPKSTDWGLELSREVQSRLPDVVSLVASELTSPGQEV